ncbi:spermidine hydroxycinnamoyl transferase-like [Quillaja saponaria]|uniref:Spermidine hydroxycinnamoyl transferase-like n=1 Tax=Quillaja saponaria TaxID=32244 RepID=A0AAD7LD77_QUISA|nr:spermidine hydroxycinnamoyl transferase-like [Quillaja saponaria]
MVTITSSYTVFPSEPTPKIPMWLSESDQIHGWSHAPSIYVYKPNHVNSSNPIERMRSSLSKILVHYYPLAGRLRWIGGGRLEVDCNAKGVQLLEAESTKEMAEYGDFEPTHTIKDLVPKIDIYSTPIEDLPLLVVQLTRFSCSGLCVGVSISHTMVDGLSAIHFINSWAKLARGDILEEKELPFLDRTVFKSFEPLISPRFEHKELTDVPIILGCSDTILERKKETSATLLRLTKEQVNKLKEKANQGRSSMVISSPSQRPYTRFEAIAGHMWRCASKARLGDHHGIANEQKLHQPTVVRFPADIRNRLNPPLPANYFGNAILRTVTPTRFFGDIVSNPLSYSAQSIRGAIETMTEEYLRSQLDFITSQKNVDWLRNSFQTLECMKQTFYGNPNMAIGSWMSLPVYEANFGWGKPIYMGPASLNADGKSYIMPHPDADGSLIIALRLQTLHMEAFTKFFYDDI